MDIFAAKTRDQLDEVASSPDSTAAQVAAARQVMQAMDGEGGPLDRILDRVVGKPTPIVPTAHLPALVRVIVDE